ncbi:hypothetical protein [Microbacterium xylanilyticum]
MVAIQVRDVPNEVREALVAAARERGESLQTYLQSVLAREARMARNRAFLDVYEPIRPPQEVDVLNVITTVRDDQDRKNIA